MRLFIQQHIESALDLEMLLVMHASGERTRMAGEIAREMHTDPTATAASLRKLTEAQILEVDESGFTYRPASPRLAGDVDALVDTYSRRKVRMIEFIYSQPNEVISSFADAFKLRRRR